MKNRLSIEEVLSRLVDEGILEPDRRQSLKEVASKANENAAPWYIKALVGFGAWVATGLFLGFLEVAGVLDSKETAVGLGFLLTAGATTLHWFKRNVFLKQFTLVGILVGQSLLLFGIGALSDSVTAPALVCIIIQGILIFAYPDKVVRFLAAIAIFGSLVAFVSDAQAKVLNDLILAGATFFAVFLLLPNPSWESNRKATILVPMGYGFAVASLSGFATVPILSDAASSQADKLIVGIPLYICVFAIVLFLQFRIFNRYQIKQWSRPRVITLLVSILLFAATHSTPGILASLALFATAYFRKSRVLFGLTCLFGVGFVAWYYYDLEISLLVKSGILVGTGAILLALRIYLVPIVKKSKGGAV